MQDKKRISITKDGPYVVSGSIPLKKEIISSDDQGNSVSWKKSHDYPQKESYSLCRCGHSNNKPFCDSSHLKANFNGTETASDQKYTEQAETIKGSDMDLTDAKKLCAGARFCHNKSGRIWDLVEDSKSDDKVKQMDFDCPSGRLALWNKKGNPIEPNLKQEIAVTEDPENEVSGPLWVKGNIPVESPDGKHYELRNRVTLCRCGKSKNKPFCDSCHIRSGFNDGDESLKE